MFREKKRYGQDPNVVVRSKPATFYAPLNRKRWSSNQPLTFTCSWSDFFIAEADAWRQEAWEIIDRRRDLIFQILTKRPERMAGRLPWTRDPWPHVWLGVSAENQDAADIRVHQLMATPAAVRFVSYEPALGPVDFSSWLGNGLSWIIFGGESADRRADARPCDIEWAAATIDDCRRYGAAPFVKQAGSHPVANGRPLYYRAHKGDDPSEWPFWMRVQELPKGRGIDSASPSISRGCTRGQEEA
jgi:protein gp37